MSLECPRSHGCMNWHKFIFRWASEDSTNSFTISDLDEKGNAPSQLKTWFWGSAMWVDGHLLGAPIGSEPNVLLFHQRGKRLKQVPLIYFCRKRPQIVSTMLRSSYFLLANLTELDKLTIRMNYWCTVRVRCFAMKKKERYSHNSECICFGYENAVTHSIVLGREYNHLCLTNKAQSPSIYIYCWYNVHAIPRHITSLGDFLLPTQCDALP